MICGYCEKEFTTKHHTAKYCSEDCRQAEWKRRAVERRKKKYKPRRFDPIPCGICGKMFTPTTPRNKYCSESCVKKRGKKAYDDFQERMAQMKTCPVCGTKHQMGGACCSDGCEGIMEKAGRVPKTSHIDNKEKYARSKGLHYADLQKRETIQMFARVELPEWAKGERG